MFIFINNSFRLILFLKNLARSLFIDLEKYVGFLNNKIASCEFSLECQKNLLHYFWSNSFLCISDFVECIASWPHPCSRAPSFASSSTYEHFTVQVPYFYHHYYTNVHTKGRVCYSEQVRWLLLLEYTVIREFYYLSGIRYYIARSTKYSNGNIGEHREYPRDKCSRICLESNLESTRRKL